MVNQQRLQELYEKGRQSGFKLPKSVTVLRLTLFGIKCGVLSRGTLEVYKNKALNKLRQLLPCY